MSARALACALTWALCASPRAGAAQTDPFELDGLVVTAAPTPRPIASVARGVTVLEGAELRARGLVRLLDALRDVPGVGVVQGGSFGAATSVFMRGGESDYVQVLVDGVQVNQPGGSFDFAGLSLDGVERIEVLRGPASSLFGSDAVAGVIHVITGTGRGPAALSATLQAGSYGRLSASAALTGGGPNAGWSFSLSRLRTDGVLPFNNTHGRTALSGRVRLTPDARTAASLSVRLSDRSYHFPTDGAGAVVDRNAFTFGDESSVALGGSRWLGDRFQLHGLVTLAGTDGGTDDQPDGLADTVGAFGFTSLDHVQRATADVRGTLRLGSSVATLGVEAEEQKQRSFSESVTEWGVTSGRSEYARWNRAAYTHLTGEAAGLSWALGGRIEDNERFGRFPTWNAGVTWLPAEGTRLRASVGTAVKEPTFYENYAEGFVRGNPALDPERARSWEVGADRELLEGRVVLHGAWFEQRFRDLIQYVSTPPGPGAPNYFNVAGADVRGAEVGADGDLGALRVGATWTWIDARVAGGGEGSGEEFSPGDRLLRRPAHTVRAHAEIAAGWGLASVTARLVGARDDRDFTTFPATRVVLDRYSAVDVALEIPVLRGDGGSPGLEVRLRAENVLDARYQEVFGFPAPGRGLYVGGTVRVGG